MKMFLKLFKFVACVAFLALFLWVVISWWDIVAHNMEVPHNYLPWNFFVVAFK